MANGVYLVRLSRLLQGLLALEPSDTTTVWRSLLCKYSLEEWVNAIDLHTLDDFKTLLSSDLPPTVDQLQRRRWIESSNPGVYLALIRRTDGTGDEHIYIGSATSLKGGLKHRVHQHKSPQYSTKAA
jgi:hypothetical protein